MNDIYSLSIVQQCRMLEAPLATDVVNQCLSDPPNARSIVKSSKEVILQRDYNLLLSSSSTHPTAQYVSQIASHVSWRDNALDHGMMNTARLSCENSVDLPLGTGYAISVKTQL